jgi:hypothetical protein
MAVLNLLRSFGRRQAAACGALALGSGLALHRSGLVRSMGDGADDRALGALWAQAFDGMIDVPGAGALSKEGVLFMVPATDSDDSAVEWPAVFRDGVVCSLTAFNPMGKDRPEAENRRGNRELHAALRRLDAPPRASMWHSFGFHPAEGWREDGFSVAYAAAEAEEGRAAILRLAREFEQAAIYVYRVDAAGALVRTVEWCDPASKEPSTSDKMALCRTPPDTPLARPSAAKLSC